MTHDDVLLQETAEDLFETALCGLLATRLDGTILRVNQTFESWTGCHRDELVDHRRFQDLLAAGARIYHETHYAPLLHMQGSVSGIAMELRRPDGSQLPVLVNSAVVADDTGHPRLVRTTVFDATERRRYERELLQARRREQESARHLQRSLLAGTLPAAAGLELDVVYRPAVRGLEVGGDWYDAFWLEPGASVGLVVGDVVGRGIDAAATMGQLRSAVRALASTGLGPGALLGALDRYAARHEVGRMTTLAYAELHLGDRRLTYACAGHPPPVLGEPGVPPRLLWDGRSVPLDVLAGAGARAEATVTLAPGSVLLLYTDGLVERRGEPVSDGLDRLLAEVAACGSGPPSALAPAVARALHEPALADDVCLLAARVGRAPEAAR